VKRPRYFCEHCGIEVKKDARICPRCGRFFSSVKCPKCGYSGRVEDFRTGCPSCGYAEAGNDAPDPFGSLPPVAPPLPFWAYLAGLAVVLAVLGLLVSITR
jgi:hypothetical protein